MRVRARKRGRRGKVRLAALALLLMAGCSSVPGGDYSTLGLTHKLQHTTRSLVQPAEATLALPRELDKQALPPYTVEPGDVLLVQPLDLDSPVRLPGDQPILTDGTINLGRFGHVVVAGKTVPEIELLVQGTVQAHAPAAGPITVRLIARQSKVFYVLGAVNAPGSFPLQGRETVLDALMAAGGLSDQASRTDIILSRPTRPHEPRLVLPVCFDDIVQKGDTTTNYQLAPGDRIFVSGKCKFEYWFGHKRRRGCCGGPQVPAVLWQSDAPPACTSGGCEPAPTRTPPAPSPSVPALPDGDPSPPRMLPAPASHTPSARANDSRDGIVQASHVQWSSSP